MEFFVYLNGVRRGPFTEERVQAFLRDGLLLPSDLAADNATTDWKPLSAFRRFAVDPATPEPAPTPAPLTGTPIPPVSSALPPSSALPQSALGPYARATLAPNETPCFQTSLHWFIFARFALAGIILFIFAAVPFAIAVQAITGSELGWFVLPLPAFLLIPPTLAFASSEIVITDRRVLIKTGIVRRQTAEVFISKVESIGVEQGFLGRMFDFGTVKIRGTGGFEEAFDTIARPLQFRTWVQRLQSGESADAVPVAASPTARVP
ncbi:MAG: PH domain-containing protein [Chthoniobacterales bacterium]